MTSGKESDSNSGRPKLTSEKSTREHVGQDPSRPRTNSFSYCRRIRQAVAIRQPLVVFLQCGKRGTPQEMCEHRRRLRLDKTKIKTAHFQSKENIACTCRRLKIDTELSLYAKNYLQTQKRVKSTASAAKIFFHFSVFASPGMKSDVIQIIIYTDCMFLPQKPTKQNRERRNPPSFSTYLNESRIDKPRKMCYYIKTNKYFARDARETCKSVSCKDSNFCMLSGTR